MKQVNKSTSKHNPLFNYLEGLGNLTKVLKTATLTTIIFIIIIVLLKPIFPILLLLIAIIITINAKVLGASFQQYRAMLFYGLIYSTVLHYLFMYAGRFGILGIVAVIIASVGFKLFRIQRRVKKIYKEINIK